MIKKGVRQVNKNKALRYLCGCLFIEELLGVITFLLDSSFQHPNTASLQTFNVLRNFHIIFAVIFFSEI